MKAPACTINRSVRDIARVKDKIRDQELRSKQYNSLCYDIGFENADPNHLEREREGKGEGERKGSRRDRDKERQQKGESTKRLIRSKSRCIVKNTSKSTENFLVKHDLGSLYGELMAVKSEYKKLKGSYQQLAEQKLELTTRDLNQQEQHSNKLQEAIQQLNRTRKTNKTLENELERIRKECFRIIEIERFKNKKLEEILQEKDLMISFLRSEQEKGRKGNENSSSWSTANQSAVMFYQNMSQLGFGGASLNSSNVVVDQGGKHEDSLSFSRDHSKEMDSIGNSLLTCKEVKKECVVIEPKEPDFYTQPSQCPTFEQREEEPNVNQLKQFLKMPPKQQKKGTSKSKHPKTTKRPTLLTLCDDNKDTASKCTEWAQPKLFSSSNSSKQRKKTCSSRKKL